MEQITPEVPPGRFSLDDLAGEDPQILRQVRSVRRIVNSAPSILLEGPVGSGKTELARALHRASQRCGGAFTSSCCSTLGEPPRGSRIFSSGWRDRLRESGDDTLFLDQVGELSPPLQARLLLFLQEQDGTVLDSECAPHRARLHIIASSNSPLVEKVANGEFRQDLYYRLSAVKLELPPLALRADRERLIRRALAVSIHESTAKAISHEALRLLVSYPWPGNIRELYNVIRTACTFAEGKMILPSDLPREVREPLHREPVPAREVNSRSDAGAAFDQRGLHTHPLQAAERLAILRTLEESHGNVTAAAQRLRISRNTIYRKMKLHRIPTRHDPSNATPSARKIRDVDFLTWRSR